MAFRVRLAARARAVEHKSGLRIRMLTKIKKGASRKVFEKRLVLRRETRALLWSSELVLRRESKGRARRTRRVEADARDESAGKQ
jgi:hypothetical protein